MFDPAKDKLLCMLVLNDQLAEALNLPTDRFWRGFVLQDRRSGEIYAEYRFRQLDSVNWYAMKAAPGQLLTMEQAIENLTKSVATVLAAMAPEHNTAGSDEMPAIVCYYPPDDGGDIDATIAWLIQQDLVELKGVVRPGDSIVGSPDMIMHVKS